MGLRARRLGETMRIFRFCFVAAGLLIANTGIAFSQAGGKQRVESSRSAGSDDIFAQCQRPSRPHGCGCCGQTLIRCGAGKRYV